MSSPNSSKNPELGKTIDEFRTVKWNRAQSDAIHSLNIASLKMVHAIMNSVPNSPLRRASVQKLIELKALGVHAITHHWPEIPSYQGVKKLGSEHGELQPGEIVGATD